LATVKAVREQFAAKRLISILELHTYSSLNPIFLPQYAGSLDLADRALVYFNPEVVIQKRLPQLDADLLKQFFYREDVEVFTDMNLLKSAMEEEYGQEAVFLLMSSGHFAGLSMP
jgi:UDP-N-acetylmuramate: L-alanyl-gamma-D-glutamyl-meso-diaminopimelate ligase